MPKTGTIVESTRNHGDVLVQKRCPSVQQVITALQRCDVVEEIINDSILCDKENCKLALSLELGCLFHQKILLRCQPTYAARDEKNVK